MSKKPATDKKPLNIWVKLRTLIVDKIKTK